MTISKTAVDTIYGQLMISKTGHTYVELAKLTGYSVSTIKIAISSLTHSGAVAVSHSKPVVIKAVMVIPTAGQTLYIRELADHIDLDPKMVLAIQGQIESNKPLSDEMLVVLFDRVKNNTHEKNHSLMVFLVNFTEVIRRRLENGLELSDDDLNGVSK